MADEEVVEVPPAEPTMFVLHEDGRKIEVSLGEWKFIQNSGGRERLVVGADGTRYHHVGNIPRLDANGEPKRDEFGETIMEWTYREDV